MQTEPATNGLTSDSKDFAQLVILDKAGLAGENGANDGVQHGDRDEPVGKPRVPHERRKGVSLQR